MERRPLLHIILFLLTVASTYWVGGGLYSLSIMTILLSHEMGHYLTSRRYGVPSSLPYFIPFPYFPFGTFGAVIKMRGVIFDKRSLFDIGASGPLCGFVLSLVCAVIGIKLSTAMKMGAAAPNVIELGDPLLFKLLERLLVPGLPPNYELVLHPVGYAAWVGLFVTALNLLPVGQLDGGHVVYAVAGEKSKWIFRCLIPVLFVLAIFYSAGWVVLTALLLVFGINHPQPLDGVTPLDRKRKFLAIFVLLIFCLSFIPAPFPGGSLMELLGKLFAK
ncbi:MAG: site-2 protease family protein [Syntrophorhabdales bacterium]